MGSILAALPSMGWALFWPLYLIWHGLYFGRSLASSVRGCIKHVSSFPFALPFPLPFPIPLPPSPFSLEALGGGGGSAARQKPYVRSWAVSYIKRRTDRLRGDLDFRHRIFFRAVASCVWGKTLLLGTHGLLLRSRAAIWPMAIASATQARGGPYCAHFQIGATLGGRKERIWYRTRPYRLGDYDIAY